MGRQPVRRGEDPPGRRGREAGEGREPKAKQHGRGISPAEAVAVYAPARRDGTGVLYEVSIVRDKVSVEEVHRVLDGLGIVPSFYDPERGGLVLPDRHGDQAGKIRKALRQYQEMGVLRGRVKFRRAEVEYWSREELLKASL